MRKEFLRFGAPKFSKKEIAEVVDTLKSGWVTTGPKTHTLEENFKKYEGVEHAVGLNSGTAALHLALLAAGVGRGDEVIVPSMTMGASANTVVHCGGTPVFADAQRDTMNIDPKDVEKKITPRTRAIMVVHMAGRACDMDEVFALAKRHKLKVVQDSAHAVETEYKGRKVAALGDFACFSFHAIKNLTTAEGGMLTMNDAAHAKQSRVLSLHGMSKDAYDRYGTSGYKHYEIIEAGYKYNMMDIQAALGIHQLASIEKNWKKRQKIWGRYMKELKDLPIILPAPIRKGDRHAYHMFTVLIDTDKTKVARDEFLNELAKRNIGAGVHFRALHLHPYYRKTYGYKEGDFPNAEWIGDRTASIPIMPYLGAKDVKDVIEAIKDIFK
ncbi:MAG: DegT/DnrJ/EryC1/StrS aminotransferase family protein [bacterium]|nr:DegT/DnrJ/EryC1/StrS aminotransferase family protein [bacterium]